jgi:glutathione S-transferase
VKNAASTTGRALPDRTANAQKLQEYLKKADTGAFRLWVSRELLLFEAAAMIFHLADKHAEAGLAPKAAAGKTMRI